MHLAFAASSPRTYRLCEPDPPSGSALPDLTPDFDGIWKIALQTWLPQCLALFWPATHEKINWRVPPVFLDKELQRIARTLKKGEKRLDVLAQLALKQGGKVLLLLHLEVQAGRIELSFPKRMFHYRIRLFERYPQHALLSCAIYLDRDQGDEQGVFQQGGFGDDLTFRFPVINLARWRHRMAELENLASDNPFAAVILAQLTSRATEPDRHRLASKLHLARQLKKWRYDEDTRLVVFQLMDGLLTLPDPLDEDFFDHLDAHEDTDMMEQLNSLQRVRLRREKAASKLEGKQEGSANVLLSLLQRKFGTLPDWANTRVHSADAEVLQTWALRVLDADRLETVFGD
ncbi:MAG: DUF4351 domain-containing protein [Pigmentiphaga sp.]|nr:DUF4351 domain-containing protein [Pigmentiphaga sp.]